MRSEAKARQILAWATGLLAVLLIVGVVGGLLVDLQAHAPGTDGSLAGLTAQIADLDASGLQVKLDSFQGAGVIALIVTDSERVIIAARPAGVVGQKLPRAQSSLDRLQTRFYRASYRMGDLPGGVSFVVDAAVPPDLALYGQSGLTPLAESLGMTEPITRYVVEMRPIVGGATAAPGEGEEGSQPGAPAWLLAVVKCPTWLGATFREWSSLLEHLSLVSFLLMVLSLAGWVWFDARRRGVEAPLAWTILTLVANVVGWATYLVARGWQRTVCPSCGKGLRAAYRACPYCGTQIGRGCPSCGRTVEEGWSFCPHCTTALN